MVTCVVWFRCARGRSVCASNTVVATRMVNELSLIPAIVLTLRSLDWSVKVCTASKLEVAQHTCWLVALRIVLPATQHAVLAFIGFLVSALRCVVVCCGGLAQVVSAGMSLLQSLSQRDAFVTRMITAGAVEMCLGVLESHTQATKVLVQVGAVAVVVVRGELDVVVW